MFLKAIILVQNANFIIIFELIEFIQLHRKFEINKAYLVSTCRKTRDIKKKHRILRYIALSHIYIGKSKHTDH